MALDRKQLRIKLVRRFRGDFKYFGEQCLKVRGKNKKTVPFKFNRAQRYVHQKLEYQLAKTGKVRALILKGRQQGMSTYVAARFYWQSSLWKGVNVYILSHEQRASDGLFKIVDRYQEYNPFRPRTGLANAKQLEFDRLGSTYTVATAGKKAGGRGGTGTLFHGSEVAFWANARDHFAASVQTVPEEDGTEIILETTANGPVGEFYERWQEAEEGKSDYQAIFVPWFWQEEYTRDVSDDFELEENTDPEVMSEVEYAEMFELNNGQMAWRRAKIQELRSHDIFDREYPATAQMAFVTSGENTYVASLPVLRARKRKVEGGGPLIMGADPAGPGGDRFAIAGRRGHDCEFITWRNKLSTSEAFHWCKDMILKHEPARFFVDAGGIGGAVLSLLREDEDIPNGVVRGVNFGERSQAKKARPKAAGPKNRRAEMWTRMKDWLEGEEPVSIPDLDPLQADITAPRLLPTLTNDIQLETKEAMRKRKIRSPDLGDALALTFASITFIRDYVLKPKTSVYGEPDVENTTQPTQYVNSGGNGWMS